MTLLTCFIAGLPFRKPATLPVVGDTVQLVPEPTNPYDPNAIMVMHGDVHLGYIPKVETATVRHFGFDTGTMTVAEVVPERKWKEIVIVKEDTK